MDPEEKKEDRRLSFGKKTPDNSELKINKLKGKILNLKNEIKYLNQRIKSLVKEKSTTDIAIMYSFPLMKDTNSAEVITLIDFETEIYRIMEALSNIGSRIQMRIEIANLGNLMNFLSLEPKIIHVISHGMNRRCQNGQSFFLAFENNEGVVFKLDSEKLGKILNSSGEKKNKIELIFLNSCHSEGICDFFLNAGVACVVCVHYKYEIKDLPAQKFSEFFYLHIFKGLTVVEAFKLAQNHINIIYPNIDNDLCCCNHFHDEKRCPFKDEETFQVMHDFHNTLSRCNCKEKGCSTIHSTKCEKARGECSKIGITFKDDGKEINTCCCPEHHSKEGSKFVLKFNSNFTSEQKEKYRVYNELRIGSLINASEWAPRNFKLEQFPIGKNFNILQIYLALKDRYKLINIWGEPGVGKTTIAKTGLNYFLERNFSARATENIMGSKKSLENLAKEIARVGVGKNYIEIILLDDCEDILKNDRESFIKLIENSLKEIRNLIFVVISQMILNLIPSREGSEKDQVSKVPFKKSLQIEISKLSSNTAIKLFQKYNSKYKTDDLQKLISNEKKYLIPKEIIEFAKKGKEINLMLSDKKSLEGIDITNRGTWSFLINFQNEIKKDELQLMKDANFIDLSIPEHFHLEKYLPYFEILGDGEGIVVKDLFKDCLIQSSNEEEKTELLNAKLKYFIFVSYICKLITNSLQNHSPENIFKTDKLTANNTGIRDPMDSFYLFEESNMEEIKIFHSHNLISPKEFAEKAEKILGKSNYLWRFKQLFSNLLESLKDFRVDIEKKNELKKKLEQVLMEQLKTKDFIEPLKNLLKEVVKMEVLKNSILYCLEILVTSYPIFKYDQTIHEAMYMNDLVSNFCDQLTEYDQGIWDAMDQKDLTLGDLNYYEVKLTSICKTIEGGNSKIQKEEFMEELLSLCGKICDKIDETNREKHVMDLVFSFRKRIANKSRKVLKNIKLLSKLNSVTFNLVDKLPSIDLNSAKETIKELQLFDLEGTPDRPSEWIKLEISFLKATLYYEKSRTFNYFEESAKDKQKSLKKARGIIWDSLKKLEELKEIGQKFDKFKCFRVLFKMLEGYVIRDSLNDNLSGFEMNKHFEELISISKEYKNKNEPLLQVQSNTILLGYFSKYAFKEDMSVTDRDVERSILRIIRESNDVLLKLVGEEANKLRKEFTIVSDNITKNFQMCYQDRLIFMRACPLVIVNEKQIEPYIDLLIFGKVFKKKIMKIKIMSNLSTDFQIMSFENFKSAVKKGGKLLHLNFETEDNHILFETEDGKMEKISFENVFKDLNSQKKQSAKIELLVLCTLEGKELAEKLKDCLNVSYIVYFNFKKKESEEKLSNYLNKRSLIELICLNLYSNFKNGNKLTNLIENLKSEYLQKLKKKSNVEIEEIDFIQLISLEKSLFILPNTSKPPVKYTGISAFNPHLCNITDLKGGIQGRNKFLYQEIQSIMSLKSVKKNIFGIESTGKTSFAKALGFYLSSRGLTNWSILYIDIERDLKVFEGHFKVAIKEWLFKNYPSFNDSNNDILYIFDNFDYVFDNASRLQAFRSESKDDNFILISRKKLVNFYHKSIFSSDNDKELEFLEINMFDKSVDFQSVLNLGKELLKNFKAHPGNYLENIKKKSSKKNKKDEDK